MNSLKKLLPFLFSFAIAMSAFAEDGIHIDGVHIKSKTISISSGKESMSEIYLTENKMLIQNYGSDNSSIMFDASTEVFTYLDNNKKEYYQFDKPTLLQLKEQIKMMARMMQQFSSQMPEDQKKKFDRILNPNSQNSITYKKINSSKKVGKWRTDEYEGLNGSKKTISVNIASYKTIGISEDRFIVMKKMMVYFKENLQEVIALLPKGGSFSQLSFDENSPILTAGIPVKTLSYSEDGNATNENVVLGISSEPIPVNLFNIPSGYVQKQINLPSIGR